MNLNNSNIIFNFTGEIGRIDPRLKGDVSALSRLSFTDTSLNTDTMKEIWRDVVIFNGEYKISNKGNVWSYVTNKILRPGVASNGYKTVSLKGRTYCIHRLVATAFIENPLNKKQVNHKDKNKTNNVITNLEWCTASENGLHAYKNYKPTLETRHKKQIAQQGENNTSAKLTNEQVLQIKKMINHMKQKEIALIYGVDQSVISNIKNGKAWTSVI